MAYRQKVAENDQVATWARKCHSSKLAKCYGTKSCLANKSACEMPKTDIQWPKGRVHRVTYNGLIMISFIMVRHRSFAFSVTHQFLFISV